MLSLRYDVLLMPDRYLPYGLYFYFRAESGLATIDTHHMGHANNRGDHVSTPSAHLAVSTLAEGLVLGQCP